MDGDEFLNQYLRSEDRGNGSDGNAVVADESLLLSPILGDYVGKGNGNVASIFSPEIGTKKRGDNSHESATYNLMKTPARESVSPIMEKNGEILNLELDASMCPSLGLGSENSVEEISGDIIKQEKSITLDNDHFINVSADLSLQTTNESFEKEKDVFGYECSVDPDSNNLTMEDPLSKSKTDINTDEAENDHIRSEFAPNPVHQTSITPKTKLLGLNQITNVDSKDSNADPLSSNRRVSYDSYVFSPPDSKIIIPKTSSVESSETESKGNKEQSSNSSQRKIDLSNEKQNVNAQSLVLAERLRGAAQRRKMNLLRGRDSLAAKEVLHRSNDDMNHEKCATVRNAQIGLGSNETSSPNSKLKNKTKKLDPYIPFKARKAPSNSREMGQVGQAGIPKVQKRPLTRPKSPNLSRSNVKNIHVRSPDSKLMKETLSDVKIQFKARKVPAFTRDSGHGGQAGVPKIKKRPTTQPVSPKLSFLKQADAKVAPTQSKHNFDASLPKINLLNSRKFNSDVKELDHSEKSEKLHIQNRLKDSRKLKQYPNGKRENKAEACIQSINYTKNGDVEIKNYSKSHGKDDNLNKEARTENRAYLRNEHDTQSPTEMSNDSNSESLIGLNFVEHKSPKERINVMNSSHLKSENQEIPNEKPETTSFIPQSTVRAKQRMEFNSLSLSRRLGSSVSSQKELDDLIKKKRKELQEMKKYLY